jgi:hypothetical protein
MKKPTLAYYTEELKESQTRLKALVEQGANALSRYDIEVAHQGNAEEALLTAKRLVGNHMKYYNEKIAVLKKQPTQLVLL